MPRKKDHKTRFDRFLEKAKNNKLVVVLGAVFIGITTLSTFGDSIVRLWTFRPWAPAGIVAHVQVRHRDIPLDAATVEKPSSPKALRPLSQQIPAVLVAPVLDVKILNNTEQTLYLNKVRLVADRLDLRKPWSSCDVILTAPSGFYDIELDLDRAIQAAEIPISQSLKPKEVDRFFLSLAPNGSFAEADFRVSTVIEGLAGLTITAEPVKVTLTNEGSCSGAVPRR